jgi:hypothetical protein
MTENSFGLEEMVGRGECHCSVNRGIYCIMTEAITEFYIGSISDEYTWFLPKEEISMPFRNITISNKNNVHLLFFKSLLINNFDKLLKSQYAKRKS